MQSEVCCVNYTRCTRPTHIGTYRYHVLFDWATVPQYQLLCIMTALIAFIALNQYILVLFCRKLGTRLGSAHCFHKSNKGMFIRQASQLALFFKCKETVRALCLQPTQIVTIGESWWTTIVGNGVKSVRNQWNYQCTIIKCRGTNMQKQLVHKILLWKEEKITKGCKDALVSGNLRK